MGFPISAERLIFSDKQIQVIELLESPRYSHITEVFYGGAAGGGKTFEICHFQIERRLSFRGTRGLIGRESLKNLKLTTFVTFCDVWDEYYRGNPWGVSWVLNEKYNTINFSNGSQIILMDLGHYPSDPEYHRLGSLELTDACIDELPEISKKCFEILQSRIRYKLDAVGGSPKCLATGNPSNNWVKWRYIKDQDGHPVTLQPHQAYIRATVHDNPNESFKATYIANLEKLSPTDKLRLLEGEWDYIMNDNPWAWGLSRDKHYVPEMYRINPNYPLDLSFDFNADPSSCVVGQVEHHLPRYNIIGSHKASSGSKSALESLCEVVRREYGPHLPAANYRVTGDATGKFGDASRPSNINRYTEIREHMNIGRNAVMVERANIEHKASRNLCNNVLYQIPKGAFVFWSGRGCEMLLSDIEAAYPDAKESLNDYKRKYGGHALDAWRYLIMLWFAHHLKGAAFKDYQRQIDAVVSRVK